MAIRQKQFCNFENDEELLRALIIGESVACTYLLRVCKTEIVPNLRNKYPQISSDEIMDEVMDAVTVIIRKITVYDAVKPVLWRISINKVVSRIRRMVWKDAHGDIHIRMLNSADESGANTLEQLENTILRHDSFPYIATIDFEQFKAMLGPREKTVFNLLCEGESDDKICRRTGIPIGSIRNIKTELKRGLKGFLAGDQSGTLGAIR